MGIVILAILSLACVCSGSLVRAPDDSGNFELIILHNNDMHARFEQTSQLSGTCTTADRDAGKCYGGFARVAHVVKEARAAASRGEAPPVLYLNAGDTYTGTAWFTIYKWRIAAELINALNPDAVSLGNHEFDDGIDGIVPFIDNVNCPVLAANLDITGEPKLLNSSNLRPSVIIDMANGVHIGIIGYLTPDTKVLAVKNNVEYIDEVIAIKEEIEYLKQENISIIIALGHSGFDTDLRIAREVEDVDLVIGGHTNTFLWNGLNPDTEQIDGPYPTIVKQASGRIVPVVQAYAYTKYLGLLNLIFDKNGELVSYDGNPILLDNSIPSDPEVLNIVNYYKSAVENIGNEIVGNTSVVLDARRCRLRECSLGNLIADAMVYNYASKYSPGWTDAPIAIIQGGGIRASIVPRSLPANINMGDLLSVMPFDSDMVKVSANGSIIWDMLEHSVAKYNFKRPPGQFLQISGMTVEYDFSKTPGNRVINATALCETCEKRTYLPIDSSKIYNILMPSFLSSGGDGFYMLQDLPLQYLPFNELDSTVAYLRLNSPINQPEEEGRITIHNIEYIKSSVDKPKISHMLILAFIPILLFKNYVNLCNDVTC